MIYQNIKRFLIASLYGTILLSLSTQQLNAEEELYVFEPSKLKRDPFHPTKDVIQNKNSLLAYDITRFQLVAILTGMGSPKAMLLLPNRQTEIIKVGDKVGKNSGQIHRITDSEVVIKEAYKDYQGKMRSHLTSLVIAD